VPEVFDCKDIVTWCVDKFVQNQRTIPLQNGSPISLAPTIFKKLLKLPEPNLTYEGDRARTFLKGRNNGIEILQEYLQDSATMPQDLSRIQASSLKDPYREIASRFTIIIVHDSTTSSPRLALYILHFTVHENAIFDWEKIISNEVSAQLVNFKSEKKFYMGSYLIFAITYCHIFKILSIGKRVNCKVDPVTMSYQALWRQKVIHYLYEFYNDFVSAFKKLLFRENTSRLSLEASAFLDTKGILEKMDNYNIIKRLCSLEKPLFIPYYIRDKLFLIEVARQYKSWFHIFYEKKKKQFIPLLVKFC
jgi:hypothetical protein